MEKGYIICIVTNGKLMAKEVRTNHEEAFECFRTIVEKLYAEVYPRLVPLEGFVTANMTDDGSIRSSFIYDDYLNTTYVILQPTLVMQKFALN